MNSIIAQILVFFSLSIFTAEVCGDTLKINGSTTVNPPVAEAAEILRSEKGMRIQVDTQGGSSGGISMLSDGLVEIGMASKPVGDRDRAEDSLSRTPHW